METVKSPIYGLPISATAEIVVEGGRAVGVRMAADDAVLRAPLVISDAGAALTFGKLLPPQVAARAGFCQSLNMEAMKRRFWTGGSTLLFVPAYV